MLALEAFRAAADPKFHPEQLAAASAPWQARRIFWNRSSWAIKPGDDLAGDVKLDVGGYNPLLGASYGEIAADSRSMHKSQGFGVARIARADRRVLSAARGRRSEGAAGEGARPGSSTAIDVSLAALPGRRDGRRPRRAARSRGSTRPRRRRRSRRWPRSTPRWTRVPDAGWRAAEAARGQRSDRSPAPGCSSRRPRRLPRRAGAAVEVTATAVARAAGRT